MPPQGPFYIAKFRLITYGQGTSCAGRNKRSLRQVIRELRTIRFWVERTLSIPAMPIVTTYASSCTTSVALCPKNCSSGSPSKCRASFCWLLTDEIRQWNHAQHCFWFWEVVLHWRSWCTGKAFLINMLLATFRGKWIVAVVVASSNITATLIDEGKTAHSALNHSILCYL